MLLLSCTRPRFDYCFFFFNDTATTEIYTLSLHDALPIYPDLASNLAEHLGHDPKLVGAPHMDRSEEHTSELQSQSNLVCRLLLEKKKKISIKQHLVTDSQDNTHSTQYVTLAYNDIRQCTF